MEIVWKNVSGYEDYYEVSNRGIIRNKITGKVLKPTLKKNGYLSVDLAYIGVKTITVHRIVATAFIDNPNRFSCVNHKDENKLNNCADNLEWCSQKYNVNFGYGATVRNSPVMQFDSDGNFIKLWTSMKEAAESLGIKYQSISRVCRGERKTSGGYKWEYVEYFTTADEESA